MSLAIHLSWVIDAQLKTYKAMLCILINESPAMYQQQEHATFKP